MNLWNQLLYTRLNTDNGYFFCTVNGTHITNKNNLSIESVIITTFAFNYGTAKRGKPDIIDFFKHYAQRLIYFRTANLISLFAKCVAWLHRQYISGILFITLLLKPLNVFDSYKSLVKQFSCLYVKWNACNVNKCL